MILRRIADAIRDQNWFTVVVEIFIVVIGIFLGLQVTEWNEARKAKVEERLVLSQLEEEFTEIKDSLERQIAVRKDWTNHLAVLVSALESNATSASEIEIKLGLAAALGTGRQAAQSTTFLQLMSSGELSKLSSTELRQALMRYNVRLNRDAFVHEQLIKLVFQELSDNAFVDRNILSAARVSAQIDSDFDRYTKYANGFTRSYDLEGLKQYETHYEAIYRTHIVQLTSEEVQLGFAEDVLRKISQGATP